MAAGDAVAVLHDRGRRDRLPGRGRRHQDRAGTLAGVVAVNVPLAWVLSHGPLGFVGIAWGTGISHALGGLVVLGVLAVGRYGLQLSLANLVPDRALFYRLCG